MPSEIFLRLTRRRPNANLAFQIYQLLSVQSKNRIKAIVPVYVLLAFLDLTGVILLASCGTIAFNVMSGDARPSRVEMILRGFIGNTIESSTLIFVFAIAAAIFLVAKTLLSTIVNYRMIRWMANQESIFSTNLFSQLLSAPLSEIRKVGVGDAQWAIMIGSARIISGVVAPLITVTGDLISILILLTTLILATPEVTFALILLLIISQRIYSYWLRGRLASYGHQASDKGVALNEEIIQSFNAVKEIKIYSLNESINDYFKKERNIVSLIGQKSSFLNSLFRYYLEAIILFSAFFVVALELYTSDIRRAMTSLVLFMSVGLRVIPSLQRFQAITMSLQLSQGMTKSFFAMTNQFKSLKREDSRISNSNQLSENQALGIEVSKVSYLVPGDSHRAILNNISLKIQPGALVAIIGESGSGKTTLIDLISDLLSSDVGSISYIDDQGKLISSNRSLVGYCTQTPYIFDSGVDGNLLLAMPSPNTEKLNQIVEDLRLSKLRESDRDNREIAFQRRVSGGERQKIGIARVFLSDRPILVFDEPTSALDKDNADNFVKLLLSNRGRRTQIIVTHDRLLALKADLLVVLSDGYLNYCGAPSDYYPKSG